MLIKKILDKMCKYIYIYIYTLKYFIQGDTWAEAKEFAEMIVNGFKR